MWCGLHSSPIRRVVRVPITHKISILNYFVLTFKDVTSPRLF